MECPVCASGNKPDGAHTCITCKKFVHIIGGCSIAIGEEEGYGEKRLCHDCANTADNFEKTDDSIDKADFSSTGPPAKKAYRRPAKYLGNRRDDVRDSLLWEKNRPIPIIRNGNAINLEPIKIQNQKVSLSNTCGFDSIMYMMIVAVMDFPHLRNKVSNNYSIEFNTIIKVTKY